MSERDTAFEGLAEASGVPLDDGERARLREAYDTLCGFAAAVRTPARDWTAKPMPSFAFAPMRGRKP